MPFILGKKIGMSRVLLDEKTIPVTLVQAGPCYVTQIKTVDVDGYNAVQLGFDKKRNINKPLEGHVKKAGKDLPKFRYFIEFRAEDVSKYELGQEVNVSDFAEGDEVVVMGTSKGKGFTGVVKRHGFSGAPMTHGHRHDNRAPGSIGGRFPQHVFKGLRMAGRSGNSKQNFKNIEVISADKEKNLLVVKGSLPGARNSLLMIKSTGK